ncbi:MAG: hypothetical protein Q4F75_01485 [Pseudomonadota bacterium]|nr:hypothetical protein [Pseudomonadota bacterium]
MVRVRCLYSMEIHQNHLFPVLKGKQMNPVILVDHGRISNFRFHKNKKLRQRLEKQRVATFPAAYINIFFSAKQKNKGGIHES